MDQVIHRVLWFDRFALDLTRGGLRSDDHEIHLRPKTFEVLRHLAENAGRLVSKQELYEAVWPGVVVTDDSLVQCIRELREKLGDDSRSLIRTLARRGYLLDAEMSVTPLSAAIVTRPEQPNSIAADPTATDRIPHPFQGRRRRWAVAAASLLVVASGLASLSGPFGTWVGGVFDANRLLSAPEPAAARQEFKDCDACPEMIALPAGAFMMGSPEHELRLAQRDGPQRRVTIAKPFAIGRFEITVDQFATFVAETEAAIGSHCRIIAAFDRSPPPWKVAPGASFREPGFKVSGMHPAGCISWHDAQAYVAWLRRRTGRPYRLPTESEWEYAARAGTTTRYSFGEDEAQLCAYAKFADLSTEFSWRGACRAQAAVYGPMPVGSLKPNPWGIFDVHGNVWEWVEDCWTSDASEAPTDGSAFMRPERCELGVVRGGSWFSGSTRMRSAFRISAPTAHPFQQYGFRVALSLDERKVSALRDHRKQGSPTQR
jgi:formylglycine-generating enzyme required for sulfatase activity/DNA-binding winged helix-turn-helix (wHTH) protein